MSVIDQAAAMLADKSATAETLGDMANQVRAKEIEARKRLQAIGTEGPEYQAAVKSADVAVVRKLDDERRDLEAEHRVLSDLYKRAGQQAALARCREARESAPADYKKLSALLDAEASALAKLKEARQVVDDHIRRFELLRGEVQALPYRHNAATRPIPPASPELLAKFFQVRGDGPKADRRVKAALGHPE